MNFETLLGAAIALYVLLNFLLLPRITKAWKASRRLSKIGKAGLLSALQFGRDTALVASAMYLAFALLTVVLGFGFGGNAGILGFIVGWAGHAHSGLKSAKGLVDSYFFLVPAALILYVCWRRQRDDFTGRFERLVDDEYDRLNRERQEGAGWDSLEPDERMKGIGGQIAFAEAELGRLGPGDGTRRRSLLRQIVKLKEEYSEADYQRRIRLEALNGAEDRETAPSWRHFLLSKGLFSDLKGATKLLSRVTLATLSVALVGAASKAGLPDEIWNRVLKLDDLRVEATKAKVEEEWKKAPGSAQNQQLTEDDRRAVAHLADSFARALTKNHNWRPLSESVRASSDLDRRMARRAILEHVELPAENGQATGAFADDLPGADREILNELAGDGSQESRVGRIVAEQEGPRVKAFFGSKWESVKASILAHAKTYQEPVKLSDLESSLVDRIVSAAFDSVVPTDDSEIVKQARSAMSAATKKVVNDAVITEFHRVMEDLADGEGFAERIAKVKTEDIPVPKSKAVAIDALIHKRQLPDMDEFQRRMAANSGAWRPPEGPASPGFDFGRGRHDRPTGGGGGFSGGDKANGSTGAPEENPVIRDVARGATHNGEYSLGEEAIDALAQYEDHFPRSVASEASTPLARTLRRFQLPADAARLGRLAELKVARAGSFSMLRGFSRVGGVLIGEDPENPKDRADIRTLTWRKDGRAVTLVLGDGAGRLRELGPYDQTLVHQALGYAADGRPVAVTMTQARPLRQLKIHLNPSLVDTPLGCRVTQLDRLVDTYAGTQLPERQEITEHYEEQFAVYNLAWGLRFKALAEAVGKEGDLERESRGAINANWETAYRGLRQAGLFDDASVFRRKPEFFDPAIVKTVAACRKPDGEAFETCVSEEFESARALKERDIDSLKRWQFGYATFFPWSGVRERTFRITGDLAFLRMPAGADRLWPFDFIVQIAFTSPPVNLPEKEQDLYADTHPIEFTAIQPKIAGLVAAGIEGHGFREAFEDLRTFTLLNACSARLSGEGWGTSSRWSNWEGLRPPRQVVFPTSTPRDGMEA